MTIMSVNSQFHVVEMSVEEWSRVQDAPCQRNTRRHAERAVKYLSKSMPSHARVALCQLPSGVRYKIDGHTRSLLWSQGRIPKPPKLLVDVYYIESEDEVRDLYDTFDNRDAQKTANDELDGALNELDFQLRSKLFASSRYSGALRDAHAIWNGRWHRYKTRVHTILPEWRPTIELIDSWNLVGGHRFKAPIMAAVLIVTRIERDKSQEFWERYDAGLGQRSDGSCDAVQALEERYSAVTASHTGYNDISRIHLTGCAFAAYFAWQKKKHFSRQMTPLSSAAIDTWIADCRKAG